MTRVPRIAVTTGEPAGIGPDVVLATAARDWPAELVVLGDPELMAGRAASLDLDVELDLYDAARAPSPSRAGRIACLPVPLAAPVEAGRLDPANARAVLAMLDRACGGCRDGRFQAMVTAPVSKAVINDAGIPFSGHTEYLAMLTRTPLPVMLLVADTLRVALVTTHLPLREVADAITPQRLRATLVALDAGLRQVLGFERPRILVLGLNPHAGEGGHLGAEDATIIAPVLRELKACGLALEGPLPADTAFNPDHLARADAVLAMYHDQGLPVLKHAGFGRAVNVTLGLPIIRTSVDHGTALDLAGTGRANPSSLFAALELAIAAAARARP